MRGTRPGASNLGAATPGPSISTSVIAALVLVILSPVALLVTLCAWGAWELWTRVRAWMLGITALAAVLVLTVTTSGPADVLRRTGAAWVLLYEASGQGAWSVVGALPRALVLWLPAGLPVGLTVGAVIAGGLELRLRRQPWHPREQQRQDQDRSRELSAAVRRANSAAAQDQAGALAATVERGDLPRDRWSVQRGLLMPSPGVLHRPSAIIAGPGAGKTEYLVRRARMDAAARRQCFLMDCKGTDPDLPVRIIAAFLEEWPDARVATWPGQPYDAWRFAHHPNELVGRFMAVESMTREGAAEYYTGQTKGLLQLACTVPNNPPTNSEELVSRLDKDRLKTLWNWTRDAEIDQFDDRAVQGARTRYGTFFAGLRGQFDGTWAYEDVDLAVITIPTLADREDGDSAFRLMLADALNYAGARKDRRQPASFVVDEFSAVYGGRSMALDLAERGRDPGLAVTLTAQSTEGIGDARVAMRMLQACTGGTVLMRSNDPDLVIKLAGSRPGVEHSWRTDDFGGPGTQGTIRAKDQPAIDANRVRRAAPGEAWILEGGGVQHVQVIREQTSPNAYLQAATVATQAAQAAHEWGWTSVYWHRAAEWAEIAAQGARELPGSRRRTFEAWPERPAVPPGDRPRELPAPPSKTRPEELQELRDLPRVALFLLRQLVRRKVGGRWGRS